MSVALGWIALDEKELKRISRQLDARSSDGTVDELGFSPLTDAIAGTLFPAFTILMTRARYFIFARGVLEGAANLAIQKIQSRHKSEESRDFSNPEIYKEYLKFADRYFREIELAIALALAARKKMEKQRQSERLQSEDEEEHGPDGITGIVGGRKLAKMRSQIGLPAGDLFEPAERYPSSVYMTGLRRLGAFSDDKISDRNDVFEAIYRAHENQIQADIWDKTWRIKTDKATNLVKEVHLAYTYYRKKKSAGKWRLLVPGKFSFDLEPFESQLLAERLAVAGEPFDLSAKVVETLIASSAGLKAGEEAYLSLAKDAGKTTDCGQAFTGAAHAMAIMRPALTLYRRLILRWEEGATRNELERDAISATYDIDFHAALKAFAFFDGKAGWRVSGRPWSRATKILGWLNSWLHLGANLTSNAVRLELVSRLVKKENRVVRERGKEPRLRVPFGLGTRGLLEQKKLRKKFQRDQQIHAVVSSGRLFRALKIFEDLSHQKVNLRNLREFVFQQSEKQANGKRATESSR